MTDEQTSPEHNDGVIDWEAAIAANRRWLRTVVVSRLSDLHAAEEVMQEIAMSVIRRKPVLDDAANVRAWLYRVALRQSLLARRRLGREKRRHRKFAERQIETNNGCESNPLNWLLADEERSLVREAIARLRPRDRELLLLKYTENWNCHELAENLGISVTAVETRLDRARGRLRRELARVEITEDNR